MPSIVVQPATQTSSVEIAVTSLMEPTPGLGTVFHPLPFQWAVMPPPTVHTSFDETAAIPVRTSPEGKSTIDQAVPSQCSVRPGEPTAQMSSAEMASIAISELSPRRRFGLGTARHVPQDWAMPGWAEADGGPADHIEVSRAIEPRVRRARWTGRVFMGDR